MVLIEIVYSLAIAILLSLTIPVAHTYFVEACKTATDRSPTQPFFTAMRACLHTPERMQVVSLTQTMLIWRTVHGLEGLRYQQELHQLFWIAGGSTRKSTLIADGIDSLIISYSAPHVIMRITCKTQTQNLYIPAVLAQP